jgi:NAD+ synthase (glutamine-hydrolysing)
MKINGLRIAVVQMNATVGDLSGNRDKILTGLKQAVASGCHVITFPELSITGYPPEDLVLRRQFIQDQLKILKEIVSQTQEIIAVIGFVDADERRLYNAAAVVQNQEIRAVYHKIQLPNYSVFDEERYFEAGRTPLVLNIDGIKTGISICEDIWIADSVTETEALAGSAEILINISASPYAMGKIDERITLMQARARACRAFIVYNNLICGQDELVFDGSSMFIDPHGRLLMSGKQFEEDFFVCDIDLAVTENIRRQDSFRQAVSTFASSLASCREVVLSRPKPLAAVPPALRTVTWPSTPEEEVYKAIVLGLGDYVQKNGFKQVVFGLSGGIDSALVSVLAADAFGAENVHGVTMPSRYSSAGSVDDSLQLAQNLGLDLLHFPIENVLAAYLQLFEETFRGLEAGITEENLQARIRGNIVMALSNKFGWLALTTGNKSEVSVGYCTIYGDMAGGFAPLKDVTKNMVYRLAEYRNKIAGYNLIPRAIIDKAPSAELRPNQKDQDSLPPYDELDQILERYVERSEGIQEIIAAGFDDETVRKVARLVDLSEYKRRQAAPGVKITPLAFGKDRRMPITNHYRGI